MKVASIPFRLCPAMVLALLSAGLPGRAQAPAAASQAPAPVASPVASSQISVIVSDDGGLDAQTARTLRSLTISELRKQGHSVSDDPAWEGIHPAGEETQALMKRLGGRTLSLRMAGRLGAKLPLSLEELRADGTVIASSSLTAASLEECDIVIPRLVESLLGRRPVEDTARIATVTTQEARPFQKRPGESRFVIGLLSPLFSSGESNSKNGFSLGYMYEAEHFLLGVEGLYAKSGDSDIGSLVFFQGAWLPFSGEFSPYFGAGIGYLGGSDRDVSITYGLGYKLTAGFEMFRLHHVRVQVGVDVYFPSSTERETKVNTQWNPSTMSYTSTSEQVSTRSSFPMVHVKLAF